MIAPGRQSGEESDLLHKYEALVHQITFRLERMRPAGVDREDAFQEGMIGLLRAIRTNKNDVESKQFTSFVRSRVRGAIIDSFRTAAPFSRTYYAEAKQTMKDIDQGIAVTAEARSKAQRVMVAAWIPAESIDDDCQHKIADSSPGPEQRLLMNEMLRRAIDVLQAQPERDQKIFIACELHGEKKSAIAARLNMSGARISQIVKEVRQRIIAVV